jgi:hypothetical protein
MRIPRICDRLAEKMSKASVVAMRYVCCFVSMTADVPKAVVVETDDEPAAIAIARQCLIDRPDCEWALLFRDDKQVALVERDPDRDRLE